MEHLKQHSQQLPESHPEQLPESHPEQHLESHPEQHLESHPEQHSESHSEPHLKPYLEQHPESHPESHPEQHPESHPEQHLESHPGQHPESHPEQHLESHPEQHPESHPEQHPESHPGQHMESHPEQHPESHPEQHPESHPGQHPESHPEQHLESHPEQHPESCPEQYPKPHPEPHSKQHLEPHPEQHPDSQFEQHTEPANIHIPKQIFISLNPATEKAKEMFILCRLCNNKFETMYKFHDHLTDCGTSGSYIFHYPSFQAYPLSEFCAYFENRQILLQESSVEISEDLVSNKTKETLADFVDVLNDLFNQKIISPKKPDPNFYEAATQTLSTEFIERQVLNMSTQTSDSDDQSYTNSISKKRNRNSALTKQSQISIEKQGTKRKSKDKVKETRGRKRKQINDNTLDISNKGKVKETRGRKRKQIHDKTLDSSNKGKDFHYYEEDTEAMSDETDIEQWTEGSDSEFLLKTQTNTDNAESESENCFDNEIELEPCERESLADNVNQYMYTVIKTEIDISADLYPGEEGIQDESLKETSLALSSLKGKCTSKTDGIKKRKQVRKGKEMLKKDKAYTPEKPAARPKLVECDVCNKMIQSKRIKQHKISHSDSRPYECETCQKAFKRVTHLNEHRRSHLAVAPFQCEICGNGFISASAVRRHLLLHKDASERPHKCEICGYGFISPNLLARHMMKHTGEQKLQCDLCGQRFKQNYNLSTHLSSVHKKERNFPCTECDQKFVTNYQLKCHMMKHRGVTPYKCSQCMAGFIQRKELKKHLKNIHKTNVDELGEAGEAMLLPESKKVSVLPFSDSETSINQNLNHVEHHEEI